MDKGFKSGDRVHVTRLNGKDVNFCGTLTKGLDEKIFYMKLTNCTNANYNGVLIYMPRSDKFGKYKQDYYTLATDEEDTDKPKIQYVNTKKLMQDTQDDKIELDNHYIVEVKEGLYVALVTSNGYLKLTKEIKKADVYEYKNAAMKHAEFVDGCILNLKRYVEVE